MNFARTALLVALALVASDGGAAPQDEAATIGVPSEVSRAAAERYDGDVHQLVFFAVLEGLYRDGVSTAAVDRLLATDAGTRMPALFVWACPLCMPALDALNTYRERPTFLGRKLPRDTFGAGLDPELERRIVDGGDEERRAALAELIERWIGARIARLRLSDAERAELERSFEEGRKIGEALMRAYRRSGGAHEGWMGCPTCDGSNAGCAIR